MRTLTTSSTNDKNSFNTTPINILKIDYAGSIGVKYYSDRRLPFPVITEQELVTSWGTLSFSTVEDVGKSKSANFIIADTNQIILGYLRSQEIYRKKFYLYQWFDGTLWSDATLLITGTIKETIRSETPPEVEFVAEDLLLNYDKKIGTSATKSIFATVNKEEDGDILPLVYGHVDRLRAVQVVEAKRTSLSIPLLPDDTIAVINDSKNFQQNVYMNLFIGSELIKGKFNGRSLTIAQRGKVVATGYTRAMSPNIVTFYAPNSLNPQGPQWIGYYIKFFVGGREEVRVITNYNAPDLYGFSPYIGNNPLPSGVYFEIYTPAVKHDAGEEVYEKLSAYKWIINDAPSLSIDKIEMLGSLVLTAPNISKLVKDTEIWVRLEDSYVTINLNDSTWAGTLGHNVTSITTTFDPKNFRNSPFKDNNFYVTLTGINYTNPLDIIVDLAQKLGFTYPTDFDTTKLATAKSAISWMKLGFAITQKIGKEILFEIAFQSRLSIKTIGSTLTITYLQNKTQTSIKTIEDSARESDSIKIEKPEEIYNKISVSFVEDGETKTFEVSDFSSITAYGEREKQLDLWCITSRVYAEAIANFWLRRWSHPYENISFTGFLNQLEVETNDWVTLDFQDFITSQPAEIQNIEHIPGNEKNIDRLKITAKLPKWVGCASSCEQYEETGCASACQQYCTSSAQTGCDYACETSTQDACNLTCVSTCEMECTTYCQQSGCQLSKQSCSGQCQTGCTVSGCQTDGCTAACTAGCQSTCTTADQSACELTCQVGCELATCQTGVEGCTGTCMVACQIGCQTGCELACQGACETSTQSCTDSCMTVCQLSDTTTSCNSGCEIFCTTTCQSDCENACRTGCTLECTTSGCQVQCTSSCQTFCQGQCEGNCQATCQADGTETSYICDTQCQTGCINACEVETQAQDPGVNNCVTSCEGYCMTSGAQTGCYLYCTVGCTCGCQITCESACRSGCETLCQCECQTSVEPSPCSTSTEGSCYSACQVYTETGCNIGCEVGCQAECMTSSCQSACEIYCTTSCRCACQETCQINCRVTCESECQTTACQTSSQLNPCSTSTEGACYSACQVYDQTGCNTGCVVDCQNHCMTSSCQSACEIYCETSCRMACQSACQLNCRVTCENTCQSTTCQGFVTVPSSSATCNWNSHACASTCQLSCTVTCAAYCETSCQIVCTVTCQNHCMTSSCQTSCEIYCQLGCRCACQSTCQCYCRTGCESTCQCLCQTAAQG